MQLIVKIPCYTEGNTLKNMLMMHGLWGNAQYMFFASQDQAEKREHVGQRLNMPFRN